MIQGGSELCIQDLLRGHNGTDQCCGRSIPYDLANSIGISTNEFKWTSRTSEFMRVKKFSITPTEFLATLRSNKGSNRAASNSLDIARAIENPSPMEGGERTPPLRDCETTSLSLVVERARY